MLYEEIKWKLFMCVNIQGCALDSLQVCQKGIIPMELGSQENRIGREANEALQLRGVATGCSSTHSQIVRSGNPSQEQLKRRHQRHLQGCIAGLAETFEGVEQTAIHVERNGITTVGCLLGSREIQW